MVKFTRSAKSWKEISFIFQVEKDTWYSRDIGALATKLNTEKVFEITFYNVKVCNN